MTMEWLVMGVYFAETRALEYVTKRSTAILPKTLNRVAQNAE
ncbi:hypothetical protein [Paenibacillus ginsengihumi]|nr:hypothetical protein [Paenibacillus ginsengihumi]